MPVYRGLRYNPGSTLLRATSVTRASPLLVTRSESMHAHRLGLMVDALEEARASLDRAQIHLIAVAGEELLTSRAVEHLQKRAGAAARELEGLILWTLERRFSRS